MKKLTFALSLAALVNAGLAAHVSAQHYDTRVDVPAIVNADRYYDRELRGDDDWQRHLRSELERLNSEVAQVRREIGGSRDGHIRERFHGIVRSTERLNAGYEQRRIRGSEVRRRVEEIRSELDGVRRELRDRSGGRYR